jgi:dipeptidyl aminopeptidase/acylaminoacyl peptidase
MQRKWPLLAVLCSAAFAAPRFSIEQVLNYSFPTDLIAAPHEGKVAWVLDERGARNIWVAEAPSYKGRRLTNFTADDGQEIDQMDWLPDAKGLVYVRGGDFETGRDNPNPASFPDAVEQAVWIVPLTGDPARKLSEGNSPVVSPKGDRVAFLKANQVWSIGLGKDDKPVELIHAKGRASELRWSPDGTRLLFVNNRGDHSLVGLYDFGSKSLRYLDPSVDEDTGPVWSPDGKDVAFVRIPASTRAFMFGPVRSAENPWSIRVASAETGAGRELWKAQPGAGSAFHRVVAENPIFWGAGDRIVFPWEKTGWVHLYSVSTRGDTPTEISGTGSYEVEHVSLTWDRKNVLFASNDGDVDRRHISKVSVLGEGASAVTKGNGIEWSPVELSDGHGYAMLRSDWKTPAHASALLPSSNTPVDLAPQTLPAEFPSTSLVQPQQVILTAADGLSLHGQLFLPPDLKPGEHRPAMIFFHGGSRRQMLLGFHYMNYYHNAYAMNQYLANLGYIVLAVNYRSGIGYGLNFREALNYGATGASEFNDVMGAGLYLKNRGDVDGKRIGLWGGSYGGYLTALGLARASDLFAVGVDFHGVHDWNNVIRNFVSSYDPNKDPNAARIAFESSPLASVDTWRSPVLLIHGDDDRNVPFHETVLLVEALRKQGVPFEQLIFPDEIHGFLTHRRWVEAYEASAKFMGKYLNP